MLISTHPGIIFNPIEYPGRLIVCVNTGDNPDYGVFSGHGAGFDLDATDTDQRMPTIDVPGDSYGAEYFEIRRERSSPPHQLRQYHYAVIEEHDRTYVTYPKGQELVLVDTHGAPWYLHLDKVTVILPDYGTEWSVVV
jgi:hypothetical protein